MRTWMPIQFVVLMTCLGFAQTEGLLREEAKKADETVLQPEKKPSNSTEALLVGDEKKVDEKVIQPERKPSNSSEGLLLGSAKKADETVLEAVEKSANPWRVSAGVDARFRYKTSMHINGPRYYAQHPVPNPPAGISRNQALTAIGSGLGTDVRRDYDNGYVASDASTALTGTTQDWAANGVGQYDNGTVSFSRDYVVSRPGGGVPGGDSQYENMTGLALDLDRDILTYEKFALKGSIGATFLPSHKLFALRQNFDAGRYETWRFEDRYDASAWGGIFPDPLQGGGLGSVLPYGVARTETELIGDRQTYLGNAWVKSRMWAVEARFCLRPEYQLFERLTVLSTLGLGMTHMTITSSYGSSMDNNGVEQRLAGKEHRNVFLLEMILGAGLRFAITDNIGISCMSEYRWSPREVNMDAGSYDGTLNMSMVNIVTRLEYQF